MIVTALERNRRRRSRIDVYLDGMAAWDVSRITVKKRGLRIGSELSEAEVASIIEEDRQREAGETALAMLARRPRSEREIRRRLTQRKVDDAVADDTVSRLKRAGLVDDVEFAHTFAESRSRISPRSRRLLEQELRAAGIQQDVAADAVSGLSDEENAYRVARGRIRSLSQLDEATFRRRLSGLLQRRGFSWATARRAVDICWAEVARPAD
jgi:regulatory protein